MFFGKYLETLTSKSFVAVIFLTFRFLQLPNSALVILNEILLPASILIEEPLATIVPPKTFICSV